MIILWLNIDTNWNGYNNYAVLLIIMMLALVTLQIEHWFTTAMPDTGYSAVNTAGYNSGQIVLELTGSGTE